MMRIITIRDVIHQTPSKWTESYRQYSDDVFVPWFHSKTFGQMRKELAALDLNTCTADDVNNIIKPGGNWAVLKCDECEKDQQNIMRFGDEPEYEARWQDLCLNCLQAGIEKLRRTNHEH